MDAVRVKDAVRKQGSSAIELFKILFHQLVTKLDALERLWTVLL
jgi:hypothetical protein